MLENKKIVVVGGGSGIGYAVARQATELGAEVVIASRSLSKLEGAARQLGNGVCIEMVDATDERSVADFFRRIGRIDHLIATIKPHLPSNSLLENELAAVRTAFDAKFWGQYRLLKQGAPFIRPNGSITLTSGIASLRSYPGYSGVSAMNAAIETLAKSAAVELAPIRVNVVCPGFVDLDPPSPDRSEYVKHLAPNLPLGRLGFSAEIANTYLYLMNNTYSTGSVVVVDGGATC